MRMRSRHKFVENGFCWIRPILDRLTEEKTNAFLLSTCHLKPDLRVLNTS